MYWQLICLEIRLHLISADLATLGSVRETAMIVQRWTLEHSSRDALGQLVSGTLAGLFDDHTNIDVDWRAPIQSLCLSRLDPLGDEAIGIALVCLNSWGRGMREIAAPGDLRVVVRDESWKQCAWASEAVKSLDDDLRLSRGSPARAATSSAPSPTSPRTCSPSATRAPRPPTSPRTCCTWPTSRSCTGKSPGWPASWTRCSGSARCAPTWSPAGRCRARAAPCGWWGSPYKVQTVLHPLERRMTWTNEALEGAG